MTELEQGILEDIISIWELNGTNRTGALVNGFKITTTLNDNNTEILISNDTSYYKYLATGTYDRKEEPQTSFPIVRKYSETPPTGYPNAMGSYPYDKKGIERIDFAGLLLEKILQRKDDIAKEYIKNIKIEI